MLKLLCTQIRAETTDRVTGEEIPEILTQSVTLEQVGGKDTQMQLRFTVPSELARSFEVGTIYPADRALSALTGAPLHERTAEELAKIEEEKLAAAEHE